MSDEAIIADSDKFTDKSMRLHFGPFTDNDVFLDLNKGANKGIITNLATIQIHWLNNGDITTKLHVVNTGSTQGESMSAQFLSIALIPAKITCSR